MDVRQPIHSDHAKTLDTAGLRRHFLVDPASPPGARPDYSQIDRIIVGGAMPVGEEVGFGPELAKRFAVGAFLERRELGAINVGGPERWSSTDAPTRWATATRSTWARGA